MFKLYFLLLYSFTLFLLLSLLIHALHFNSFVIQSLPFTSPFPLASLLVTQALISTYLSLKPFHLHLSSSKLFLPPISSLSPCLSFFGHSSSLFHFSNYSNSSLYIIFIQALPCTSFNIQALYSSSPVIQGRLSVCLIIQALRSTWYVF